MLLDYLTSEKVQRYCLVMKIALFVCIFCVNFNGDFTNFLHFFYRYFFMKHTVLNSKYQCIDKTTRQREKKNTCYIVSIQECLDVA